jgi:hypothetical protein
MHMSSRDGKLDGLADDIDRHLASQPTRASAFEQFVRLADPSQRKHRADHRLDQAAFDQVRQRVELAPVLTAEHEVIGGILSPSLDQVLRLRDVNDADYPSSVRDGERASRQGVAADGVEYDVHALPMRQVRDGRDIVIGGVIDDLIRAERPHELMIAAARRRDDPRTHRLGKLDRHRAHTAGTTMDQDRLVNGKLGAGYQGFPDRQGG